MQIEQLSFFCILCCVFICMFSVNITEGEKYAYIILIDLFWLELHYKNFIYNRIISVLLF